MENAKQNNKFSSWLRTSITARMLMVGFLILVLLVPLNFIKSLIYERAERQNEVITEINEKWGNEVLLSGPILKVPYKTYTETLKLDQSTGKSIKERKAHTKYAFFFPDALNITSKVQAEPKNRSIYETIVYMANMQCSGAFSRPNFSSQDIPDEDVLWDKVSILIQTSNLKGIRKEIQIDLGGKTYGFVPKYKQQDTSYSVTNPDRVTQHQLESSYIDSTLIPTEGKLNFSFDFDVNGSKRIRFIPIGKETQVSMTSNWADPSFMGNFLPLNNDEEKVTENGFTADWSVLQTNRQFQQQFFEFLPNLSDFAFGVTLIVPVDQYQKSERTAKYGFLVIGLTFLVFFLIQTLSKIGIHPFQYLMIGIALTMFYTLLISISEHSSYLKAYLIAGSAVILLITLYSRSILKNWKFPIFIALSLTALYAFIFVIIQLESYALLVGSVGLFVILAAVMFVSRKIDWQQE